MSPPWRLADAGTSSRLASLLAGVWRLTSASVTQGSDGALGCNPIAVSSDYCQHKVTIRDGCNRACAHTCARNHRARFAPRHLLHLLRYPPPMHKTSAEGRNALQIAARGILLHGQGAVVHEGVRIYAAPPSGKPAKPVVTVQFQRPRRPLRAARPRRLGALARAGRTQRPAPIRCRTSPPVAAGYQPAAAEARAAPAPPSQPSNGRPAAATLRP